MSSGHRPHLSIALLALSFAILLPAFYYAATIEDAHITYRYANHLAAGHGLGIWNVGEPPVEGSTTMLWTLILALGVKLGLPIIPLSKVLGWLSLVYMVALSLWCGHRATTRRDDERQRPGAFYALAMALAMYPPLAWYAVSGMEASFFAALVLTLLLAPWLSDRRGAQTALVVAMSIALPLTRPEGMLFVLAINGYRQLATRPFYRIDTPAALGQLAGVATILALTGFRYAYFGEVVPNTYFAKADGGLFHIRHGLREVWDFARTTVPLWAVVVLALLAAPRRLFAMREAFWLALFTAVYAAYVIKVGADPKSAFPLWRHFVHLAPVWLLLVGFSIATFTVSTARPALIAAAVVGMCSLIMVSTADRRTTLVLQPLQDLRDVGFLRSTLPGPQIGWLAERTDDDALIAVSLAGVYPYYVPGSFIDMLGLNDRHIARHGTRAADGLLDSKSDVGYVLSRQPDIIDGYMSGKALLAGTCPGFGSRGRMLRQLRDATAFRDHYAFVRNAPYGNGLDRAIFVRIDFAAENEEVFDTIAVVETALYAPHCLEAGS